MKYNYQCESSSCLTFINYKRQHQQPAREHLSEKCLGGFGWCYTNSCIGRCISNCPLQVEFYLRFEVGRINKTLFCMYYFELFYDKSFA